MNTEQIRLRVAIALTDALEAAECLRKTHVQDGDSDKAAAFEAMMAQAGRTVGQQWQKLYEMASRERAEMEARIAELEAAQVTPEPYPAEMGTRIVEWRPIIEALKAINVTNDLMKLDEVRLLDIETGDSGTRFEGMDAGGVDHLDVLLVRRLAIWVDDNEEYITITDAGRDELARITSQGEV